MKPEKSYKNLEFLNSPEARAIRILCEYEEPKKRFEAQNVTDTIVFFGSARARSMDRPQPTKTAFAEGGNLDDATPQLETELLKAGVAFGWQVTTKRPESLPVDLPSGT